MDKFLDRYKILKLNQDQVNHLNNPITPKEIEESSKASQLKKPSTDGFSAEFHQTFIAGITPILAKLFYKIDSDGILPNSFF